MKRVALATVILSAMALTARAQPARENASTLPPQTRSISGRVVADDTGDPIANARVTLSPATAGAPVVLTDRDGRFALTAAAARVRLTASKSSYGHQELAVTSVEAPLELRLRRAAAISGRVVDEFGDPLAGARVVVERATPELGPQRTIVATGSTDDRGDYRIGSLPPGAVVVVTTTRGEMVRRVIRPNEIAMFPSTLQTYYPGTQSVERAETITLQPGDERSPIDFVLPAGQTGDFMSIQTSPLENATDAGWTGIIRGRIVSTDGRAVPRAQVRTLTTFAVRAPDRPGAPVMFRPISVTADIDGRFEFTGLPAGPFRIAATKVGYSAPDSEAFAVGTSNAGVAVELKDGEVRERIDVTLAPWGTLSGRIVDELGDPLQGVSVQLLQVRYQGGRRRLVGAGGAARLTDDLGRYRMFGLAPGRYVVSATIGGVGTTDLPGYTRSYFPGTPNAGEAQFVSMALSQENTGIDFSMSRARTARISGTLLNAAGEPSTSGSVRLVPSQRSESVTSVTAGARLTRDGQFEFPNVTPGQYVIQVDRGRRNAGTEGEFGTLPVSVGGSDISDLVIQTSAGSSIAGRITFDTFSGTVPRIASNQIEVVPLPVDADRSPAVPGSADIHQDWSFEVNGVNGPRRLQLARVPPGWTLKEIRVRGIDVTDRSLDFGRRDQSLTDVEIILTDRINEVSGTIVDDHARGAAGSRLIVFPIDRDRWYPASRFLRLATAGTDGVLALAGLPAGSYYAAAVARLPADGDDAWQEPAYLESLVGRAVTFALGEGQKHVLNLKVGDR
jgi:protocatechuate 3,4-dioxygenase beta subunit